MAYIVIISVNQKLSVNFLVRATRAVALGVAALYHKVFDYSVERKAIIEALVNKL